MLLNRFSVDFFVYFNYYLIVKQSLHRADITMLGIILHVSVYLILWFVCMYVLFISERNMYNNIFIVFFGWLETIVLYVIPFALGHETEFFMQINSYLLDYLCIYGVVVVLYSVQFFYFLSHRRNK